MQAETMLDKGMRRRRRVERFSLHAFKLQLWVSHHYALPMVFLGLPRWVSSLSHSTAIAFHCRPVSRGCAQPPIFWDHDLRYFLLQQPCSPSASPPLPSLQRSWSSIALLGPLSLSSTAEHHRQSDYYCHRQSPMVVAKNKARLVTQGYN